MNAKTALTILGLSAFPFFGWVASFHFSSVHPAMRYVSQILLVIFIIHTGFSRWLAARYFRVGSLLGCPFCGARSRCTGKRKACFYFECPSCGPVSVTARLFRTALATRLNDEAE